MMRNFTQSKCHQSQSRSPRGFTLLVAIIFTSVILSVSLALLDVSFKQVLLSSTARQSQYAFYAADSAMECALEMDQVYKTFDYTNELAGSGLTPPIQCEGQSFTYAATAAVGGGSRTTTFAIPCAGSSTTFNSSVTIYKSSTGATNIYANGFNDCNASDPYRVERGLKSNY